MSLTTRCYSVWKIEGNLAVFENSSLIQQKCWCIIDEWVGSDMYIF